MQLLLWFNLALIFPTIGIPGLFQFNTVEVMTPFVAAMLGLGIQQGAYTSEVVRSGLLSVDSGQYEAAQTIGMTRMQTLRRIVLPQAMRVMVPPVGNEVISMVKLTSLATTGAEPDFEDEAYEVEAVFPELTARDTTKWAAALQQVATAMLVMVNAKLISRATAVKMLATVAGRLGVEIDAEDELANAEQDAATKAANDAFNGLTPTKDAAAA